LKVVADPVAQGAHENAAHHRVESTLSGPEVAEQIQQVLLWMGVSEKSREILLPCGVLA